jgi:hypothetical protein
MQADTLAATTSHPTEVTSPLIPPWDQRHPRGACTAQTAHLPRVTDPAIAEHPGSRWPSHGDGAGSSFDRGVHAAPYSAMSSKATTAAIVLPNPPWLPANTKTL